MYFVDDLCPDIGNEVFVRFCRDRGLLFSSLCPGSGAAGPRGRPRPPPWLSAALVEDAESEGAGGGAESDGVDLATLMAQDGAEADIERGMARRIHAPGAHQAMALESAAATKPSQLSDNAASGAGHAAAAGRRKLFSRAEAPEAARESEIDTGRNP